MNRSLIKNNLINFKQDNTILWIRNGNNKDKDLSELNKYMKKRNFFFFFTENFLRLFGVFTQNWSILHNNIKLILYLIMISIQNFSNPGYLIKFIYIKNHDGVDTGARWLTAHAVNAYNGWRRPKKLSQCVLPRLRILYFLLSRNSIFIRFCYSMSPGKLTMEKSFATYFFNIFVVLQDVLLQWVFGFFIFSYFNSWIGSITKLFLTCGRTNYCHVTKFQWLRNIAWIYLR